jgi:hypothetical protein
MSGNGGDFPQRRLVHRRACRVVGVGKSDEPALVAGKVAQCVEVEAVAVPRPQAEAAHLGAEAFGDRDVLLVGGHDRHHPVARLDQRLVDEGIGADRAMGDDNLVGASRFMERGDRFAQPPRSFDRAIGQFHRQQIVKDRIRLAGEAEEFLDGQRFDAGLGEIVAAIVLVAIHPHLDGEFLDPHDSRLPCKRFRRTLKLSA